MNTANQFPRDIRLPIRFLSPNAVTGIHQTGHVINSTAVEEGIKLFRSYLTARDTGGRRRQTKDARTLRRQDIVAIWLHFAAAAYAETVRRADRQDMEQAWDCGTGTV